MRANKFILGCLFGVLSLGGSVALAQTVTASITGTVTDPSGAAIKGAAVLARNVATGGAYPAQTNEAGVYIVKYLPIGTYTLKVSAQGFDANQVSAFPLQGGQEALLNEKLKVGEAGTVITVTDETPSLNTVNAELSTTLDQTLVQNMPLVADNVVGLALFMPGVVQPNANGLDNTVPTVPEPTFNANGNREQSNNFTLDGVDVNNNIDNYLAYNVNRDALQEFRIITGNGNAEYGNANGGQTVMVLRSGTNAFHGGLSFQFQNTEMNANTWANKNKVPAAVFGSNFTARPIQNRDYFSGTLGGPIFKQRLFFFVDYKGIRQHVDSTAFLSTPDPAYDGNPAWDMTGQAGLAGTGTAYDPYLNKAVPVTNPAAIYLLSHPSAFAVCTPAPATGAVPGVTYCNHSAKSVSNNYQGYTKQIVQQDTADAKIDYHANRDTISGRFSIQRLTLAYPHENAPTIFPLAQSLPYTGFVVNWDRQLSNSIANEARVGFSRSRVLQVTADPGGQFGTNGFADLGIPNPQVFPGIPQLLWSGNGAGLSTVGSTSPDTIKTFNAFQYGDDLDWQYGRNSIKIGVAAIRYQENFYTASGNALGSFTFSGTTNTSQSTGSNWADFLSDKASTFAIGNSAGESGQRQWRLATYVQDDYKALPNLTFNIGVRWEFDEPMTEVLDRQTNMNPLNGAISFAGKNGASRALYNAYYGGFMPRLGFALSPKGFNNRLVIRGGYGITNYFEGLGTNQRLTQNPEYVYNGAPAAGQTAPYAMTNGFPALVSANPATYTKFHAWAPNLRPALVQQFDLLTGYQITKSDSLQVGYAGQLGHHIIDIRALNSSSCSVVPIPGLATPCQVPLIGVFASMPGGGVQYTESEAMMNYNALQATFIHHVGHGLELLSNYSYGRAMTDSTGFYGNAAVPGSQGSFGQDPYNMKADYGAAYYDAKHVVSFASTYQLPIGHGKLIGRSWNRWVDGALGGWRASFTAQYHTGFPLTILSTQYYNAKGEGTTARANHYRPLKIVNRGVRNTNSATAINWFGTDPSAEGLATSSGSGASAYSIGSTGIVGRTGSSNVAHYSITASPACAVGAQTTTANLNPSVVAYPELTNPNGGANSCLEVYTGNDNGVAAYGEELTTGHGTGTVSTERGPVYSNLSASASKQFVFSQGRSIDFRADAFNVTNSASLGQPNTNISSNGFGQITGVTSTERHLQLSLKLNF